MDCPKCGSRMTAGINTNEEQCCNVIGCGYEEEHYVIAVEWQAQADKYKNELEVIRERLERIKELLINQRYDDVKTTMNMIVKISEVAK
jgi:transcription initiation factor TFIIIB Brf1 subunit/transcription initiation factor TFIIB